MEGNGSETKWGDGTTNEKAKIIGNWELSFASLLLPSSTPHVFHLKRDWLRQVA
jgi:hypothetical protein